MNPAYYLFMKIKTSLELLAEAIGSNHVEIYSGLSTTDILELRNRQTCPIYDENFVVSDFGKGFIACGTKCIQEFIEVMKGNVEFWQGVLIRMILKENHGVNLNKD